MDTEVKLFSKCNFTPLNCFCKIGAFFFSFQNGCVDSCIHLLTQWTEPAKSLACVLLTTVYYFDIQFFNQVALVQNPDQYFIISRAEGGLIWIYCFEGKYALLISVSVKFADGVLFCEHFLSENTAMCRQINELVHVYELALIPVKSLFFWCKLLGFFLTAS